MATLFNNPSFVQNINGVGTSNGRQAVGNDKGGPSPHDHLCRLLNEMFRFGIYGAGGLIEN